MYRPFCALGYRVTLVAFILAIIVPSHAAAQTSSGFDLERLGSASRAQAGISSMLTAEQIPTDDVIDASIYYLGPGDVLSYQTTGLDFTEKMVMVTPENTVLMERIGMMSVEGLTLQQLRDSLTALMKNRSADVGMFITLRKARLVYVTLRGNVTYPGTYAVPASMRVSTFLTLMRQPWLLSKDAGLGEMAKTGGSNNIPTKAQELTRTSGYQIGPYAMRNIAIRHRNKTSTADIPKSRVEGFKRLDPHVREGDEIIVPFEDRNVATISIAGAVVTPQTLSFKKGDKISLLLTAAGGPTDEADIERVYLVQAEGGGKQKISVDENLRLLGPDEELQPGSTIIVERKAETGMSHAQGVVQVYGEVENPGAVVIRPGYTRLNEVLRSVGGVSTGASMALSYIVRPDRSPANLVQQRDEAARTFQYSDLKLEDTTRYHIDQKYRLPYVSCDFAIALADTASEQNIALQHGDIVVVQPTPDRVFVYGQVTRPGYVPYTKNKRLDWYVEKAGGFAAGAEKDRARIIKGKSKVWVEDGSNVFVEPGDEIYVPRPPDIPYGTQIQTYAIAASIIASVVALTATVISLLR